MASARCSRCGATASGGADALCPGCLLRLAALPQSRLPDYEIETLLGEGTDTTSYLARASGTSGLLVVRSFAIQAADQDRLDALRVLGETLARLRDPHLARTYGVDEDPEGIRVVRDYIAGRPWTAWKSQAPAGAIRRALASLRAAVERLHARDLAHGRISPANIIVAADEPVLLDAGVALAAAILRGFAADIPAMQRDDLARIERS